MNLRTSAGFVLALTVTARAWAIPVFTPPWVQNPANPHWANGVTTSQSWEFWNDPHSQPHDNNPFGTPQFNPSDSSPQNDPTAPVDPGNTWHVNTDGGGFSLIIPNSPIPQPLKTIHLQYTSDKASSGAPSSSPGGSASAGGVAGHGGDWYTYEWTITIMPNPEFEYIFVEFPESTNIGEIDVSTICHDPHPVPEPSTFALLGIGAVGLLAVARRRRAR